MSKLEYAVRRGFGRVWLFVIAWLRRDRAKDVDEKLRAFYQLRGQWHRLAEADFTCGVSHRDPRGAGHIAYHAMEREVERLCAIPIPWATDVYGWCCGTTLSVVYEPTYGALAQLVTLSDSGNDLFVPVGRRAFYLVGGWRYQSPMTEGEGRMVQAIMDAIGRDSIALHELSANTVSDWLNDGCDVTCAPRVLTGETPAHDGESRDPR